MFSVRLYDFCTPIDDTVFVELPHCVLSVVVLAGSLTSVLVNGLN